MPGEKRKKGTESGFHAALESEEKRPDSCQIPSGFSFPLATAAEESGFFDVNANFLLDSPTGSGKTHVVVELARRETARGRGGVLAVPLRALADELHERLSRNPDSFSRVGVALCTGAQRRGFPWRPGTLTVATYESLWMHVNLRSMEWLSSLAFVAVDEIHLLESSRGALLEEMLVRLFRLAPFCRILAMSGTLDPEDSELAAWLDAAWIRTLERPVPLRLRTEFVPAARRMERIREILVQDPRPSLVFVHSRRRAIQWAKHLQESGIPAAVHHAGMSLAEQRRVVAALESGELQAVVATPTLEMGVNLPVDRVFCPDLVFPDKTAWRRIPVRTLHQRLGRAGRSPGRESAEGVVFAPPGSPDPLCESFGPVQSRLPENLDAFILHELADGMCRTRPQLERAYQMSLAARRGCLPDWDAALEKLQNLGFLASLSPPSPGNPEHPLALTSLGKAAARQFGRLDAFAGALAVLRRECTPFDVLWLSFCSLESESWLDFRQSWELARALAGIPSFLLCRSEDFHERLGISRRVATCALAATAAFLAWGRTPKAQRATTVHWNTSHETHRLRIWRVRRTLDAWIRTADSLPDDALSPISRQSLLQALELLKRPADAEKRLFAQSPAHAPALPVWPDSFPANLENASEEFEMRLQRALQCRVTPESDGSFIVRHHGPEYRIRSDACSCPDFSDGRACKHVLAVRIHRLRGLVPHAFDFWNSF